jgi:hypothetical protein
MKVENCSNCEMIIGKLEPAYVFNGDVVCQNCYQRLTCTTPDLKPSIETVRATETSKKAESVSLPLKELKLGMIIIYVVAIIGSIFLVDFLCALILGKLFKEISDVFSKSIVLLLYCILGLVIANFSYKLKKSFIVLGISCITIFPVHFLLVLILYENKLFALSLDSALVKTIAATTAIEAITIFLSTIVFILLFRFVELKFNFAEIRDIEKDVLDPKTKKKYDVGICGRCGVKTKIAEDRFMSNTFGKSERHFCDNCGIFLRDNPFKVMLFGLAEGIASFTFFMGVAASISGQATMVQNVFLLVMIFGIIDGVKRLFSGIKGVFREKKKNLHISA